MTQVYRAALIGCSRIGAFIDNEIKAPTPIVLPYSHATGYESCPTRRRARGTATAGQHAALSQARA